MEPEVAVVPSPAKSQSLPGLWVLACYWKTFESTVAKSHPTPGCPDTAGRRALADGIYRCVPWSWKQGRVWCPGGPPLECLAQKPGGLMHLCISLFVELDIAAPHLWLLLCWASVAVAFIIVWFCSLFVSYFPVPFLRLDGVDCKAFLFSWQIREQTQHCPLLELTGSSAKFYNLSGKEMRFKIANFSWFVRFHEKEFIIPVWCPMCRMAK